MNPIFLMFPRPPEPIKWEPDALRLSPDRMSVPEPHRPLTRTGETKMHIYAIIDTKAAAIIGGLQLYKHPAQAVRVFGDIASDPKSMIAKHPEDYELQELGTLTENNTIVPISPEIIITGRAWLAAQAPTDVEHKLQIARES